MLHPKRVMEFWTRCSGRVLRIPEARSTERGESVFYLLLCISLYRSLRVSWCHLMFANACYGFGGFNCVLVMIPVALGNVILKLLYLTFHRIHGSISDEPYSFLLTSIAFPYRTSNCEFPHGTIIVTVVSLQQSGDGSVALTIAAIWTGLIHLALGVLGTFVLKRFPTSFSVGFFLGVLVVLANQNIILYASFHKYTQGSGKANQVFALLGFMLFAVLSFMTLLLVHFKNDVVISPMDTVAGDEGNAPPTQA